MCPGTPEEKAHLLFDLAYYDSLKQKEKTETNQDENDEKQESKIGGFEYFNVMDKLDQCRDSSEDDQ